MKNLLFTIFIFSITNSFSQSETLFSTADISGFGGPFFSVSNVNEEAAFISGGGGGVIIGDFFIGGFGEGTSLNNTLLSNTSYDLDLGYGGLWMGYSFLNDKAIHPFLGVKLGTGNINIDEPSTNQLVEESNIRVLSPEAGVEFNMTFWFRLVVHAGYRGVSGMNDLDLVTSDQLSGMTGGLTLRFGYFR